jgi:ubiquinone biosynthesis protein
MSIIGINRGLRNIRRARRIIGVFAKYGFRDVIDRLPVARKLIPHRIRTSFLKKSRAERLRLALEELGPAFVKFGQLLSVRADMLPPDFVQELSRLQDRVPPLPFAQIKEVVETELKAPMETLFRTFDEEPIASASLAQVHGAVLEGGDEVVVKIQRPNVKRIIDTDLSIMETIAGWVEREIRETREYEPLAKVREIGRNLKSELNFTNEGRSIDRFRVNFGDDESILIPEVYWNFSNSKVLTLRRVECTKITDSDVEEKTGLSRKEIALKGMEFVFEQIFVHRFFHADPHPGNMLLTSEGKIVLLDFGLTGTLDDELVESLTSLLVAAVNKDVSGIISVLTQLEVVGEEVDTRELRSDLRGFVERYHGVPLARIEMRNIADETFEISRRHRMRFPRDLLLLAKTLSTLEGIVHQLDPEFDIIEHLKLFAEQLIKRGASPGRLLKVATRIFSTYLLLLKELPGDLVPILRKIRQGKLKVEFEHRGLDNLISQAERSTNRLSISLIIAALIVGSSLIMQTSRGPLLFGVPVLGGIGFVIAGILGIGLIVAMLRSRRL